MQPLGNRARLFLDLLNHYFKKSPRKRQIFRKSESAAETKKGLGIGSIFWRSFQRTGVRERENKIGNS